jgi:hypothetical protein
MVLSQIDGELQACRAELREMMEKGRWLGPKAMDKTKGKANTAKGMASMLAELTTLLNTGDKYKDVLDGNVKKGIEDFVARLSGLDYNKLTVSTDVKATALAIVHEMLAFMYTIQNLAPTFMEGAQERYTRGVIDALTRYIVNDSDKVADFLQLFREIGRNLSIPEHYSNVPDAAKEVKTIMPQIGRIIASV